ncbi:MAG: hypothetical protein E5X15_20840 [Mesorhizobium sp.]|nr:MAG: hypothetical protein E5X15_20840 [Mesorhizobium sp.]
MFSIDIKPKTGNAINYYDWTTFLGLLEAIVNGAVRIREADLNRGGKIEDISAPGKSVRTIRAEFVDVYGSTLTVFAAFDDQPKTGSEIILHPTDDPEFVIPHLDLHEPDYQG